MKRKLYPNISREQAVVIAQHGIGFFDTINKALDTEPCFVNMDPRQLSLILMVYVVATTKHTQLKLDDFLTLAVATYDAIEVGLCSKCGHPMGHHGEHDGCTFSTSCDCGVPRES